MFLPFSSVVTRKLSQDGGLKCFVEIWFVQMTFPVHRAATNQFSFCDHSSCNTDRAELATLSGVVDNGRPSLHSPPLSGVTDCGRPSLHSPTLSGVTDYGWPSLHSPIVRSHRLWTTQPHSPTLSGVTDYGWPSLIPQHCQESQTVDDPASTSHHCQESQTMDDPASTSPPLSAVVHYGWPSLTSSTLLAVMNYGWQPALYQGPPAILLLSITVSHCTIKWI